MVCRLTQRDPSLRMLWKLVRKKTQLSNAFLVNRKTSVSGGWTVKKSERQTAPCCFSLCFPVEGEGTPAVATSNNVDESLLGLGQNCFLFLRPDDSSKQAPLYIKRAEDDGLMEMRNAVLGG